MVWASQTGHDALGECLIPEMVVHSRNKLLIPHPKPEKLYQGKDTSIPKWKEAVKEGVTEVENYFKGTATSTERLSDHLVLTVQMKTKQMTKRKTLEEEENMVTVDGETMYFDTSVKVSLNGGRDRMPAQSRFKMFQGHKVIKISLDVNCDRAGEGNCKVLSAGTNAVVHGFM